MNIAIFPKAPEGETRAFTPEDAPDLVIDWERFGRFVQAFRTKTGIGTTRMGEACGVHRAQISRVERLLPVSANTFMRICTLLNREPSFFCKTLGGWQPHQPD